MFLFGAVVTAVMILLVVPAAFRRRPAFYAARRPDGAHRQDQPLAARAAAAATIDSAAARSTPSAPKPKVTEDPPRTPRLRPVTLLLAFGYLFHTITFYYILKFAVQIVADSGFSPARGGEHADLGQHRRRDRRVPVRLPAAASGTSRARLIACAVLGSAAVAYFGLGSDSLVGLARDGVPDDVLPQRGDRRLLRRLRARLFLAFARATGTGFVLGVGRAGAAGSPIIAGFLFMPRSAAATSTC